MSKRLIPFQPDKMPDYLVNDVLDSVQHFNRLGDMRPDHWNDGDYSPKPIDINRFAGNIGWNRIAISNDAVMSSLELPDVAVMMDSGQIGRLIKTMNFEQGT